MNRVCIRSLVLFAIATLLITSDMLFAQEADRRLIPDPVYYDLPSNIAIQSGAERDSTILVVWGTRRGGVGGAVVNSLVMQRCVNGRKVGEPERFHSEEARPYGYVKVLSVRGGFLVLWNDNRSGGAGLYMRKVLLDGTLMGSEIRIGGEIRMDPSFTLAAIGGEGERMTLIINGKDGIRLCELDPWLNNVNRNIHVGNMLQGLHRFPGIDDLTFVVTDSASVRIVEDEGRIVDTIVDGAKFHRPHFFEEDSTVYLIRDHAVEVYESVFDADPVRRIPIPEIDSSASSEFAIVKDSTGDSCYVIFPVISWVGEKNYERSTNISLYGMCISDTGIDMPQRIYHWIGRVLFSPYREYLHRFNTVIFQQCAEIGQAFLFYGTRTRYYPADIAPDEAYMMGLTVENGPSAQQVYNSCSYPSISTELDSTPTLEIHRTSATDTSKVVCPTHGGHTLELSIAIDPERYVVVQFEPSFSIYRESIFVWYKENGYKGGRYYVRFENCDDADRSTFQTLELPGLDRPLTTLSVHRAGYPRIITQYFMNYGGPAFIWHSCRRNDLIYRPNDIFVENGTSQILQTYFLGENVWERIISDREFYWVFGPDFEVETVAYDPNSEVGYLSYIYDQRKRVVIDTKGNRRVIMEDRDQRQFVSLNNDEFMVVSNGFVRKIAVGKDVGVIPADSDDTEGLHRRMYGDKILRIDGGSGRREIILETYDLDFNELAFAHLQTGMPVEWLTTILNPVDSSIILLWGGSSGVRASVLSQNLQVVEHDIRLSATADSVGPVSGVVRDSTLLFIWQDFREGRPLIYVNTYDLPEARAVERGAGIHTRSPERGVEINPSVYSDSGTDEELSGDFLVIPNPSVETPTIRLDLPHDSFLTLDLFDALGRRLASESIGVIGAGRREFALPVESLPPGTYNGVLTVNGRRMVRRFVVLGTGQGL